MRRAILLTGILVLNVVGTSSAGLVAHYALDGNADDSSGNGLHGALTGSASFVLDGIRGGVLELHGNGDCVNCGHSPLFDMTAQISLVAWVKLRTVPASWNGIITKGDHTWRLSTVFQDCRAHFALTNTNPQGYCLMDGDAEMVPGRWYHLCATYDGIHLRLYLNGFEDTQSYAYYEGLIGTSGDDVHIGGNASYPGREFDGWLDDVLIFDHALFPEEVAMLAGRGGGDGDWIVTDHDMYAGVQGNVGIGVAEPQQKLHVAGLGRFDVRTDASISLSTPGGWPGVIAFSPNGHRRDVIFDDSSIRLLTGSESGAPPATNGITILENGNVGVGTSSVGDFKLAVNGSAAKAGGGSWSNFSDGRLKNPGDRYKRGLSAVIQLEPVCYSYTEDNALGLPADQAHIGLIAQDVQAVIPEAVEKGGSGYLMVNNDPIIWAMVNAIGELKRDNDRLRAELETIRAELNSN